MSFNRFLTFLLLTVIIICVANLAGCEKQQQMEDRAAKQFKDSIEESLDIGANIRRTDDLEKGVSCYVLIGRQISCVKTR